MCIRDRAYHKNMNKENYMKWICEKLLPKLEPQSVLVIDNTLYHNIEIGKAPRSNSQKDEMKQWLIRKGIPCSDTTLKPQLHKLIKLYKRQFKTYVLNDILESEGHGVLRLSLIHI